MIENKISRLIDLLKAKEDYLNELLNATKKQASIIKEDKIDELEETLNMKSKIIEKVNELDIEFLNIFNDLKKEKSINSLEDLSVEEYPLLKDLKKATSINYDILEEMSLIDKNNTRLMELNLKQIKSNLKDVKDVKKAYKGYHYEPNVSILLDEKK